MKKNNNPENLNSLLSDINKISIQILEITDVKKLFHKLCQYLAEVKKYKFVWASLRENENDKFTPVTIICKDKKIAGLIKNSWTIYEPDENAAGMDLNRGLSFLIKDLKKEGNFVVWDKIASDNGYVSELILPIMCHKIVMGMFHIYSDNESCFSKEEIKFLEKLGENICTVVKNIKNEKVVKDSRKEYGELFNRIGSCVAIYEAKDNGSDFIIRDFNHAAEKTEKVNREDIIGRSILKVFPGVKDFGLFDVLKRVYRTGKPENHPISIYKDNRISGWRENFVYKLPNGKIVAAYNDLTEKKRFEMDLIRANEELSLAQRLSGTGIWDWDIDKKNLSWTPEFFALFGLDARRDIASFDTWRKTLHPEDRQKTERNMIQAVNEKKPLYDEYRIIDSSGKIRWINVIGDTMFDKNGNPLRMSGICIDISGRKKTEEDLKASYEKTKKILDGTIKTLSTIIEMRDPYTSGHQQKVAEIAVMIAREMKLKNEKINGLGTAAIIHDIGKIIVPPSILVKPGLLNEIEYSIVKEHPETGYNMLKNIDFPWPVAEIVLQHHERINGTGYPKNFKGEDIMIEARILAVADILEAMTSHRPYRPSLGLNKALKELVEKKGVLYDSVAVDVCIKLIKDGKINLKK
jgi:PAS domain S-box-containing protein/putative nucleotidyltransferase with HDIG domain